MRTPQTTLGLRVPVTLVAALSMLIGACAGSDAEPLDLESIGLAVDVDIQAGTTFEVAVPTVEDLSVVVVSAPVGVEASVSEPQGEESMLLTVAVEPNTPAGDYNVLLRAETNGGDGAELEWPFGVIQPDPIQSDEPSDPESVRDEVLAAVAARDAYSLRSMWPASTWETLGVPVLESFVPAAEVPACDWLAEDRAHCIVFEADVARALEMTMELGADGWMITAISLESTN